MGLILGGLVRINAEFQTLNTVDSALNTLADDIRYYDQTLTDAVRAYIIDPDDAAAYARYYADVVALDDALKEAQRLATTAEDRAIFASIDRVNVELVALEESLLANPDLETAIGLYRGRYGELKAEYSALVQQFFVRQQERESLAFSRIMAQIERVGFVSLGLVLALLVISVVIALRLSQNVLSQLAALIGATQDFAQGNLRARVQVVSRDELGQLGNAFNDMAAQQEKFIRELDLARREAEEATRMKDLFLATMSHELRTPLNAIMGFLHLMNFSGQLDEDNTYMSERALANTHRLMMLINNILDLSRIATGGLEIVPVEMSPRYVASGLYNDLKMLAQDKQLRLDLEVDPTLPETINHDEARLSQIVVNLVGNAIKFTESGTVQLAFTRADDRLVIRVADTGIGIPRAKHGLIFDDFFQVDASSTRQHEGAGLGLAIVKRLVLMMNGKIELASEVGKGSTFTVTLPLNLPRYEPGEHRRASKHLFQNSGTGSLEAVAQAGGAR